MFQAIREQEKYNYIGKRRFLLYYLLLKIRRRKLKFAFLVRSPYSKLESFFEDKFRKKVKTKVENKWQFSQIIFFKHLQLSKEDTLEKKRKRFLTVSFEEFIKMLPTTFLNYPHLHSQTWAYNLSYSILGIKVLTLQIPISRVFKIESKKDMNDFASDFELNLEIKLNVTNDIETPTVWSQEMKDIVNKIYGKDFEELNNKI